MSESGLKKIGVIGIGTMGNGISQVSAQSGFDTVVMDVDASVLDRGLDAISRSLDRLVKAFEKSDGEKGITGEAKDEAEVVRGVAGLQLVEEPETLLGERWRKLVDFAVARPAWDRERFDAGLRYGLLRQFGGQAGDGRMGEEGRQGEIPAQVLAQPSHHLGSEHRVPPQLEEIIVHPDLADAEVMPPDLGDSPLQSVAGS